MFLKKKGVRGKILVSQYLNFTHPEALKRLLQLPNIDLKIAITGDFHSKGYLFKHGEIYDLIIGSSNLTSNALCSNIEWNLKISATHRSSIIVNAIDQFTNEFDKAIPVTAEFITDYEEIYKQNKQSVAFAQIRTETALTKTIQPNSMQVAALDNLAHLRQQGKTKALLISATGTGKTYLSAFDAKKFNAQKVLFVVHRLTIAKAAMATFSVVFGNSKTIGLYSGNNRELDKDFIFSTIQTITKDSHLQRFAPNYFDYIVIDESHRAGAESYLNILNYFNPKFLLGMTATPERTDGLDIFKLFDHNIAYEIRLHRAMEENMLSPFHYYGVTDISINGIELDENASFSLLTSSERIQHIVNKVEFFGTDTGTVRGLIFCSKIEECKFLSTEFNKLGYKTLALVGTNSEDERSDAIMRLESDDLNVKIDYIFTVDIFNEGVDIPRVNQIIMLRPTQSAIIFVQQLGRGLRKLVDKDYLTIIDFIGNYSNNYLVPIALYGDTSYNKDSLRKFMSSGSSLIPGTSTINFDEISRNRIFEAIDSANMQMKNDLVNDYKLLKYKLGVIPMMLDYNKHGSRDPDLYVKYSKSYFNFAQEQETSLQGALTANEKKYLELFSNEINNSKRVEESLILRELMRNERRVTRDALRKMVQDLFNYDVKELTIDSCVNNLNFKFVTKKYQNKMLTVNELYKTDVIQVKEDVLVIDPSFNTLLDNSVFYRFLNDNTEYAIESFTQLFHIKRFFDGFVLYRKYSRKDVFRILNWDTNPLAQNVGGYIVSKDETNCPIFVNYHKDINIANTTKYEDRFISNSEFEWLSKSRRTLDSRDVKSIRNYKNGLRMPLFIKKSNDEGTDFYYMGDVIPKENAFAQSSMPDDHGKNIDVVKVLFTIHPPVEENIYKYITSINSSGA
jgi:superfamily II DNA or RNA helicase